MAPPDVVEVAPLPERSVWKLSLTDRWLGEILQMELPRRPEGAGERDLAADCFWAAFRGRPEFLEPPPPERSVNRLLLEWLTGQAGWDASCVHTQAHIPASLLAAPALWANLTTDEVVRRALEEQAGAEEAAKAAEEARREAQAQAWQARALEALGDREGARRTRAQAQALLEEAAKAQAQAQAQADAAASALAGWRQAEPERAQALLGAAARAAREKAAQAQEVLSGWGLGPGTLSRMSPQGILALVKRLNAAKIRRIARLAGRLRNIALSARRSRVARGPVPYGLARTQDLQDALPEELAGLSPSAPAPLRARKAAEWASDGLLGIVRRGEAREGGPFLAAVDVSGSMAGAREETAKAIALALAMVARDEGRDFCLVAFSSAGDPLVRLTAEEAGRDPQALLEWAAATYGGGTDFDVPIRAAMDWIGPRPEADCVFISDGEARPSEETAAAWKRFAQETGARLLYVPVATGYGAMEKLADRVLPASELIESEADRVAREVGRWMK
ncbi:MAG: vWA domain-containing protein [Chloroflexia bacterium]